MATFGLKTTQEGEDKYRATDITKVVLSGTTIDSDSGQPTPTNLYTYVDGTVNVNDTVELQGRTGTWTVVEAEPGFAGISVKEGNAPDLPPEWKIKV